MNERPTTQNLCGDFGDPTVEDLGRGYSAPIRLSCERPTLVLNGTSEVVWIDGLPVFIPTTEILPPATTEDDDVTIIDSEADLENIVTTSMTLPLVRLFYLVASDEVQAWHLHAGSDAAVPGQIVWPDDRSSGVERAWYRTPLA